MRSAHGVAETVLVAGLLMGAPGPSTAQDRDCELVSAERSIMRGADDSSRRYWLTKPVFECPGGTRIQADSSIHYDNSAFHQFYENVTFVDKGKELTAQFAQYFARSGRLDARGDANTRVRIVTLETGDTITGSEVVLLQANEQRLEDQLTVRGGRPRAVFHAQRSLEEAGDETPPREAGAVPYEIVADWIYMEGEGLLRAKTRVEIERAGMEAYADSAEFDQAKGRLLLFRRARILRDSLDVRGDTMAVLMPNDALEELESRGNAHLIAGEVMIDGKVLRVFFVEDEPSQVIALRRPTPVTVEMDEVEVEEDEIEEEGAPERISRPDLLDHPESQALDSLPQAKARAEDFTVTADSIEVDLPGGRLRRLFAAGVARAVSSARDSLNEPDMPEEFRSDWLVADTVIATFVRPDQVSVESEDGDATNDHQLDTLLGRVNAKTFYRMAPRDTVAVRPDESGRRPLELNYTLGDEIKIFLNATAEVDSMNVENPKGAYLQPAVPARPAPDTTSARR